MVKAIFLKGRASSGKTPTLKSFILSVFDSQKCECIESGFHIAEYLEPFKIDVLKDILTVMEDAYILFKIDDKYVGITSQGDYKNLMTQIYNHFSELVRIHSKGKKVKCDVFVSAVRTRGQTIEFVNDNFKKNEIEIIKKTFVSKEDLKVDANRKDKESLIGEFKRILSEV